MRMRYYRGSQYFSFFLYTEITTYMITDMQVGDSSNDRIWYARSRPLTLVPTVVAETLEPGDFRIKVGRI